jgi:hypothetical protein
VRNVLKAVFLHLCTVLYFFAKLSTLTRKKWVKKISQWIHGSQFCLKVCLGLAGTISLALMILGEFVLDMVCSATTVDYSCIDDDDDAPSTIVDMCGVPDRCVARD